MSLRYVRLRQVLLAAALGGALAVTGCSTTGPKQAGDLAQEAQDGAAAKVEKRTSVEYINVVGEGNRVLIGTTGPVRYTVFKLSDPSRLIVDMPGVDLEKVTRTISVGNEFLGDISTVTYGENKDIGRIVIGLRDAIDHEVKSGDNSILVSLSRAGAQAKAGAVVMAASDEASVEPVGEAAVEGTAAGAAEATEPEKPAKAVEEAPKAASKPAADKPARQASKIIGVESKDDGDNTVVRVFTDGLAGNYTSFTLSKPARIVVDIWGVMNSTGKDARKLQDRHLKTVRIGSYADKTRLVFDGSVDKLPPYAISSENGAMVITIGPKVTPSPAKAGAAQPAKPEAKLQPKAEAPAPQAPAPTAQAPALTAAAMEPPAAAQVKAEGVKIDSIDYIKVGAKGRLTVSAASKPEYRIKEGKDGKTIAIDLPGAVIPDALVRTLDASRLSTPVQSVSSYQDSVSPSSVRVLVKLKDKAAFSVQESGNSLVVDFAQITAEPAAPVASKGALAAAPGRAVPDDKSYTGKRVDLDMMDANVSDVLRLLAEISNLNIIASDDVKGTISLRLKNVPWDQAFDIIMKTKGLDSIREGNVVRVAPALKIRQEREAALASRKAEEKLEDMDLEFISVNYATAEDLVTQVKTVLSERGEVTTDKRTNMLIVKDIKSGIVAARNVIARLDTPIPQVLIEARIVEASSSFARDLGVQWGVDYQTGGNVSTTTFGSTSTSGQDFSAPTTTPTFTDRSGANNFAVNLPASGTAGPLGALGFIIGKAGVNPLVLDLRISAGESQGQLKTISRPRITTLDNKEAKIEQGEAIPFETTSASGTATTFIDANLSLTVTPHITPDGSVLMTIKASRNSIGTFRTAAGQPSINKKEATTDVLVKDGETTVIGGIVITDRNDSEKGIPLLKDIPVLGWLFKSKSVADSQTELLIFITPKILKEKTVG